MNDKIFKYICSERVEVSINQRIKDPKAAIRATERSALSIKHKEEKKELASKYLQFRDQYKGQKQSLLGKQKEERENLRNKQ
jgi:hypothetical protein